MVKSTRKILSRASDTSKLQQRIQANTQFSTRDFEAWSQTLLSSFDCRNVLDLCCGTGNQLVKLLQNPNLRQLVGFDISADALEAARQRTAADNRVHLIQGDFDSLENYLPSGSTYDLATCFYGLYYARDVDHVIRTVDSMLIPGGNLLVVGPYGDNNASIFSLLANHFPIPPFVKYSSTNFMQDTLIPIFNNLHYQVDTQTFVNEIKYPSVEAVLNYWKSSTFFHPEVEAQVTADLQKHFATHQEFIVAKHIMACNGTKT